MGNVIFLHGGYIDELSGAAGLGTGCDCVLCIRDVLLEKGVWW